MTTVSGAWSQARQVASAATVTILTDGVADTSGLAAQAINELAEALGRAGKLRVLPIAGLGAVNNVRELLYLPGIDFAILNSDIFSYLDLTRQFPEGRRRIRHVVQLHDQLVLLLARKKFKSVQELEGRRVLTMAAGGGGNVTAATVFGLQGIPIKLETLQPGQTLDDARLADVDAVLLLSGEYGRAKLGELTRQEFHVLALPLTPALQKAYRAAAIEEADLANRLDFGKPEGGKIATLAVGTSLASFDWSATNFRYKNVAAFIQATYAALPALRKQQSSAWHQAAVEALPPGWTRYAAARPRDVLSAAQLGELAPRERPKLVAAAPPPTAAPKEAPVAKRAMNVLAAARPPLADERLADGGIVGSLLRKSIALGSSPPGSAPEIRVQWTRALPPPIESVLDDRVIDLSFPIEAPDCERPNDLTQTSAVLCDQALFSDPILHVVIGLFRLASNPFPFDSDDRIFGKTLCLPQDRDASILNAAGRNWLADKRVTLLRQPSLVDCLSAVQRQEADALVASDLEARFVINQLGLASLFAMAERPLATHTVHAVVARTHARAGELIESVNSGLRRLKQTEAYASVMREHLSQMWRERP
ncbi:MAG: hypothetical protein NW223_21670 [Hyphomicrobiaceae bacterium]|nr:hypothetical protein [Hyphomicrobiaceae bacterium]